MTLGRSTGKMSKNDSELFRIFLHNCSQSSLNSNSSVIRPIGLYSDPNPHHQRRGDYLTRLFEKKKLKDKSLSKKMKTPFDRKLYRTCWPVELKKVTRIKKKPAEKKRKKPTNKSLERRKRKFTSSILLSLKKHFKSPFPRIVKENFDDITFTECLRKCHFLYEPITPQLLIDVLKDPEHLKSGATLDTIIAKLRAFKLHLNPAEDLLREEVMKKIKCGLKLGLVIEKGGYFRVAEAFARKRLPKRKIDAFWTLWYQGVPNKKSY